MLQVWSNKGLALAIHSDRTAHPELQPELGFLVQAVLGGFLSIIPSSPSMYPCTYQYVCICSYLFEGINRI